MLWHFMLTHGTTFRPDVLTPKSLTQQLDIAKLIGNTIFIQRGG